MPKRRINIVTGITGQDGSYMAQQLLADPTNVVIAFVRGSNITEPRGCMIPMAEQGVVFKEFSSYSPDTDGKNHLGTVLLCHVDLRSDDQIRAATKQILQKLPWMHEYYDAMPLIHCYHFAALSHVHESYDAFETYMDTNALGTARLYRAVLGLIDDCYARAKQNNYNTKMVQGFFYHAATTELFSGDPKTAPQHSETPMDPRSPYGVSKLAAFKLLEFNNTLYGERLAVRQGILGNHESPRRPTKFVTQKILRAVKDWKPGAPKTPIGNIHARRDWGSATEYMEVVQSLMQPGRPECLVIGTGRDHSVLQFIEAAISICHPGQDLEWDDIFQIDGRFIRPSEVQHLCVDTEEARECLGWSASVNSIDQLIQIMLDPTDSPFAHRRFQ